MHDLGATLALFLSNQPVATRRVDINGSKQTAKPCSPVDDAPMTFTHFLEPLHERNPTNRSSIRRTALYVKRVRVNVRFHPDGIRFSCGPRGVAPRLSFCDDVSTRGWGAPRSEVKGGAAGGGGGHEQSGAPARARGDGIRTARRSASRNP